MSSIKNAHSRKNNPGRPRGSTVGDTPFAVKLRAVFPDKTLAEVGVAMNVSADAARRYLSGENEAVHSSLAALHAATRVDLNWLLDDSDNRPGPVFVRRRKGKSHA
jgi:hypothetical protein